MFAFVKKLTMSTNNERFKAVILKHLADAAMPIRTSEFYTVVESVIPLDEKDLQGQVLKGRTLTEPAWKRNVRNALQSLKDSGKAVNIQVELWRMSTPDPAHELDGTNAWETLRRSALQALKSETIWTSPKRQQRYQVAEVHTEHVLVKCLDSVDPVRIIPAHIERAIVALNAAGGSVGRRTIHQTVAIESSIVQLYPEIDWDPTLDWIELLRDSVGSKYGQIITPRSAQNDVAAYHTVRQRIRKHQAAFKKSLMAVYDGRCCISGESTKEVLDAAHIEPHRINQVNHYSNGLLLRTDLHALFDTGLLKIHPESKCVSLDPALRSEAYRSYEGVRIRQPNTPEANPSKAYLSVRWGNPVVVEDDAAEWLR